MIHDIIPDIHADLSRLEKTLQALGYRNTTIAGETRWRPPAGHRAGFLGDFIDAGPQNREVLKIVRSLHDAGDAIAVMGNHELNAILYHSPGVAWGAVQDGWMRAHTAKNRQQHGSFLAEYPADDDARRGVLAWFLSLPLAQDLGDFRIVHACWSARALSLIADRRPSLALSEADLQEVALEETGFARAVALTVKGPEIDLPPGAGFRDFHGTRRGQMRLCGWQNHGPQTYRSAALSVPDPMELPDRPIPASEGVEFYPDMAVPVFFGHYKLQGDPGPVLSRPGNAVCLDWPDHAVSWRIGRGQSRAFRYD